MAYLPVSSLPFGQHSYVTANAGAQTTEYTSLCGAQYEAPDLDDAFPVNVMNSQRVRIIQLVQNGSGSTIEAGTPLNWVSGQWGVQVQPCPFGQVVRGIAPAYVNHLTTGTIPNGAFFMMVVSGPTNAYSDGTAIAVNQGVSIGAATGQLGPDQTTGGGLIYGLTADAIVNTVAVQTVAATTPLAANTLRVGDIIRIRAAGTIIRTSGTITILITIGATTIVTTGAITNAATGDEFFMDAEIKVTAITSSGTIEGMSWWVDGVPGTAVPAAYSLASTTIDTTASQAVAIQVTPSISLAGNSVTVKTFDVQKLTTTIAGLRCGTAMAAAAGGSPVSFRVLANCQQG